MDFPSLRGYSARSLFCKFWLYDAKCLNVTAALQVHVCVEYMAALSMDITRTIDPLLGSREMAMAAPRCCPLVAQPGPHIAPLSVSGSFLLRLCFV